MRRGRKLEGWRVAGLLGLGLAVVALLSACGEDFGAPCNLPASEVVREACGNKTEGEREIRSSCIVKNILECENHLCAVYKGSSPFCTLACSDDSNCPGTAVCVEFVVGSGEKYCVKQENL